jgi:protease-4
VDELGGLDAALAKARSLAGLPADAAFAVVSSRAGFLDVLDSAAGEEEPDSSRAPLEQASSALGATTGRAVESIAPELAPYLGSLAVVVSGEHTLTALPFAVLLR